MTARTSAPVWIVDSKNVGKSNPTYPSMKIGTQLISSYGGGDVVSQGQVTVPLSTAQITGMFANPVPILPSPGAGYAVVVTDFIFYLIAGTTPFQKGGNVELFYASGNSRKTSATGSVKAEVVNAAASTISTSNAPGLAVPATVALMANFGLTISNSTDAFTTGNGSAKVTVLYTVISL
ncbi:hypothetical protein Cva_01637 [Caedimonas varicaedens]|uniref:Uncharacterized protein n=1 Tax=Caedimonas varicaedens TaxID=1629334 RepID=A0A0K8MEU0_9PROT|nr:hypothetical protein Cva_01637 [Caedimonas varicaedens]